MESGVSLQSVLSPNSTRKSDPHDVRSLSPWQQRVLHVTPFLLTSLPCRPSNLLANRSKACYPEQNVR